MLAINCKADLMELVMDYTKVQSCNNSEVAHHGNKNGDGCDEAQGSMMDAWDFECRGEVVIKFLSHNNQTTYW